MDTQTGGNVSLPGAPDIEGLSFRHFRGDEDWQGLADASNLNDQANGTEGVTTAEKLARDTATIKHFDIAKDMLIAELGGKIVGNTNIEWWNELDGKRMYWHFTTLVPEMRGRGLEEPLQDWAEARIREIDRTLPEPAGPRLFSSSIFGKNPDVEAVLSRTGYEPIRYGYSMVRPLDDIPEAPMPEGLEVRPARPEDYKAIWLASEEAFQDHWGAEEPGTDEDFERWTRSPQFQPTLWKVAWDGDQVAGMVLNFVDEAFNSLGNRKRGYTEDISVRRPWRRRGLARALIAQSMAMFKQMGMTEVALSVDTQNPSGALQLYEDLGYRERSVHTTYTKPFSAAPAQPVAANG